MNLNSLNKWLTLIANLGVLIGIIFLAREIDQSNRIAVRDGRSELISQELEFQRSLLENPEITALLMKLSISNPELSPTEAFQAETIAQQIQLRIANLMINYESGFLEGPSLERQTIGILSTIERIPGIAPILSESLQRGRAMQGVRATPILERFVEELKLFE